MKGIKSSFINEKNKPAPYARIWRDDNKKWHLGVYVGRKLLTDRLFDTYEAAEEAWKNTGNTNAAVKQNVA